MGILSKIKSLVPASSRSLHAMHYELGQMHGQMGEMWGEVGQSRYMLIDVQEQLRELERQITNMDTRIITMLWELYRNDGEDLSNAKHRMLTSMSPASGDLRMYQLASAQLLFEFDELCQKNGLNYWLVSGTLLGAVRHKGFIPWDDDLDVGMTRADISRIIEVAGSDERYRVTVCYDWYVNCRQVRFCYADQRIPCFIDLFYFDPVAKLGAKTLEAREAARAKLEEDLAADERTTEYWNAAHQYVSDSEKRADPIREHFYEHINGLYESGVLCRNLDEAEGVVWGIDNVNSGVSHHSWYVIPKEAIFPIARMPFEGRQACVPADADRCLRDIFGDYWDIPEKIGSYFNHFSTEAMRKQDVRDALSDLADEYSKE